MPNAPKARRVTIYRDTAGEVRYRVQAGNWQTIETSEEGFNRPATVRSRVAKKFPGVELVDETAAR